MKQFYRIIQRYKVLKVGAVPLNSRNTDESETGKTEKKKNSSINHELHILIQNDYHQGVSMASE